MVGFAGRISVEGEVDVATNITDVAIKHAETLRAWKTTQGIANVVKAYDLGGGYYTVIADLEAMRSIHIVIPSTPTTLELPQEMTTTLVSEGVGVADVVSGRVNVPIIDKEKVSIKTPNTIERVIEVDVVRDFTPTQRSLDRNTLQFMRRRLAVKQNQIFSIPTTSPIEIVYSEHRRTLPTVYTGAMRRLVQLILGIGKVLRPTYEERWITEKKKTPVDKSQQLEDGGAFQEVSSAFGLYENNRDVPFVRLDFDYRFGKTHGIVFDEAKKPWLVEIGTRGVHAMPVYMDPVSQTVQGRARYLEVNPELEEFFKDFNGLPLGTTMPTGDTFEAMKRAGEIVELISKDGMKVFYDKMAYCSEHGWVLNDRGTEAHNTCYGVEQSGLRTGYMYSINFALTGETLPEWNDEKRQLAAYFNTVWQQKKARRMANPEVTRILRIFNQDGAEAGRKAFNDAVVERTLIGTAKISLNRKGSLYHPAKNPDYQPQIKFPEPLIGGLLSFDFYPGDDYTGPAVECNTPMHVCYDGNLLDTVYYFYDATSKVATAPYNTREQCQIAGTWESRSDSGEGRILGNFYSSKIDWREIVFPIESGSKSTIKKIGHQNYAGAVDFFSRCIVVGTTTWFHVTTETNASEGRNVRISVAIPLNDRNGYYMAKQTSVTRSSKSVSGGNESYNGPKIHYYELYNFVFHWVGGCSQPQSNSRCVAKKVGETEVSSCLSGPEPDEFFYSVCPENGGSNPNVPFSSVGSGGIGVIGSTVWPQLTLPSPYTRTEYTNQAQESYEIKLVNSSGHGVVEAKKGSVKGTDPATQQPVDFYSLDMSIWWWIASPQPDGSTAYIADTHSCLGTNVMNYMDDIHGTVKWLGGPENMRGPASACYTGVIE